MIPLLMIALLQLFLLSFLFSFFQVDYKSSLRNTPLIPYTVIPIDTTGCGPGSGGPLLFTSKFSPVSLPFSLLLLAPSL